MRIDISLVKRVYIIFKVDVVKASIYTDENTGLSFDVSVNEGILEKSQIKDSVESNIVRELKEIQIKLNEIKESSDSPLSKPFKMRSIMIFELQRIARDYNLKFDYVTKIEENEE